MRGAAARIEELERWQQAEGEWWDKIGLHREEVELALRVRTLQRARIEELEARLAERDRVLPNPGVKEKR